MGDDGVTNILMNDRFMVSKKNERKLAIKQIEISVVNELRGRQKHGVINEARFIFVRRERQYACGR